MDELRYTLLSDGPSDKALMPILTWLLRQVVPDLPIQPRWADLRRLYCPPRQLCDRIQKSIELFPCDLLFVHRDAETTPLEERLNEIKRAVVDADINKNVSAVVCVVPVRMTEAWLLFDVEAIRQAAGNPNGTTSLQLPSMSTVENLTDPKRILNDLLRKATGLGTHRRRRFVTSSAVQRIPEYIEDFSPLRVLPAFVALEANILRIIESQGWNS